MKIQIVMTIADEADVDVNHVMGITEEAYLAISGRLMPYGDIESITQINEPVELSGKAAGGAGLNLGR